MDTLVVEQVELLASIQYLVLGCSRKKNFFLSFASLATIFHTQTKRTPIRRNLFSEFEKKIFLTVFLSVEHLKPPIRKNQAKIQRKYSAQRSKTVATTASVLQIPLLHTFDDSSFVVSVIVPGFEDSIVSGVLDFVVIRQHFTQLILVHSLVKIKLIVLVHIIDIQKPLNMKYASYLCMHGLLLKFNHTQPGFHRSCVMENILYIDAQIYESTLHAAFDCVSTVNNALIHLINHLFVYVYALSTLTFTFSAWCLRRRRAHESIKRE